MALSFLLTRYSSSAVVLLACLALSHDAGPDSPPPDENGTPETFASRMGTETSQANELLRRQPGFFVPNLGQWNHAARFVHHSGPMSLFLQDRGWIVDLAERPSRPEHHARGLSSSIAARMMPEQHEETRVTRGVALRMTFEGDAHVPEIVGERRLPGHHDYFLGNDERCWRTDVPLYSSVRYENLYPSIDLRLREANGRPEYDLLLQPGADLSRVSVRVEGAKGISIARDGSLVIETMLGPLTQSVPKTWQVNRAGTKQFVACNFTVLGGDRFGFAVQGWDGDTSLTIDPGLIWSTFLGGNTAIYAVSIDASGVVTVAGVTSPNFPTTVGAYDTSFNGITGADVFVSRLDPSKIGAAQLVYSTFLGGGAYDELRALFVEDSGAVTVTGFTRSSNFPTTSGAIDRTFNGGGGPYPIDGFVSRLDPNKTGIAQLDYSTFLGGYGDDVPEALTVEDGGRVVVAGWTRSRDFPTTRFAHGTSHHGGDGDAFVSQLLPGNLGRAGLLYSTYFGGSSFDTAHALSVDRGVITLAGYTGSADFPTTNLAYNTGSANGPGRADGFVSQLDPTQTGVAQLVYSTFLAGNDFDWPNALSVDASGVVTVVGLTSSKDFPTTSGAYDTSFNGATRESDVFVSRLDPIQTGVAQLVYSTFLGGSGTDWPEGLSVRANGVVTVAGYTRFPDFPTTSGAFDTTYNGGPEDGFVSRLDLSKTGIAQLVYSTFLGGSAVDEIRGFSVDASGVVTVVGYTNSTDFPATSGAYDPTFNGSGLATNGFLSRVSMGVAFYGDRYELSLKRAGTQNLNLDAGQRHAGKSYAIFGSITGTSPGINLFGVHIPLNLDPYTDFTIGSAGPPIFGWFQGTLDRKGEAKASLNVPAGLPPLPTFTLHHAYVVFDSTGKIHMASNSVPLHLK